MKNRTKKKGSFLIVTGLLLIAAALVLSGYNLWTDKNAGEISDSAAQEFLERIAEKAVENQAQDNGMWVFVPGDDAMQAGKWLFIADELSDETTETDCGRWVFIPDGEADKAAPLDEQPGRWILAPESLIGEAAQENVTGKLVFLSDSQAAGEQVGEWIFLTDDVMEAAEKLIESRYWVFLPDGNEWIQPENGGVGKWILLPLYMLEKAESLLTHQLPEGLTQDVPDYVVDPNREMPDISIDGNKYIGVLQIPALDLQLPVMKDWSYTKLRSAPCRYSGSAYKNNLVICGHNYNRHFGNLKSLRIGSELSLTDADGNTFLYKVVEIETLKPHSVDQMKSGDWDLTLFTCTVGGATRVTVRCDRY